MKIRTKLDRLERECDRRFPRQQPEPPMSREEILHRVIWLMNYTGDNSDILERQQKAAVVVREILARIRSEGQLPPSCKNEPASNASHQRAVPAL